MSIGVIGGADGPTSVFVAPSVPLLLILAVAVLLIGGIVAYLCSK